LFCLPVALLVAGGSIPLRHDPPRLVIAAGAAAVLLPMFLLLRQWPPSKSQIFSNSLVQ